VEELRYERAAELCHLLGALKLRSGRDVRAELRFGGDFSFWDIVAPFLVLYRFPLLFPPSPESSFAPAAGDFGLRPLRGRLSRIKDHIVSPLKNARGCPGRPKEEKTVLFLGFMKTFYRDVLSSVAESLVKDGGLDVVVLGQDHKRPEGASDDKRLEFHSLWEHWDADAETEKRALFRGLKAARRTTIREIRAAARSGYFPFLLNIKALSAEWSWLFIREFKRLIPYVAAARHILKKHRPALIVSADDADQRCRVFSLAGRSLGIPSLLIQQGLSKRIVPEWTFFSQDKVAAMNATSRSDMTAQGVPADKITVTGHPGFDRLLAPAPDVRQKIRSDFGLKKEQKLVLFASQPYYFGVFNNAKIRRLMIRSIVQAANRFENLMLAVKPHPGENIRELKKFVGRSSRVAIAGKMDDITDLIQACDIFITFFSTSALQALYAGKPVINVDFPESGGSNIYTRSGATWTARSEEEIVLHLENLLSGTKTEETEKREKARLAFLRELTYIPDGKATLRAAQIALEMIRS
jgi:UDP-N-acetylglucosamine:LPS N-acetylglucosamine transferase